MDKDKRGMIIYAIIAILILLLISYVLLRGATG